MLTRTTIDKLRVQAFALQRCEESDLKQTEWRVAYMYAMGCCECYDRKDWAMELLGATFTIAAAYDGMVQWMDEDPDDCAASWIFNFGSRL